MPVLFKGFGPAAALVFFALVMPMPTPSSAQSRRAVPIRFVDPLTGVHLTLPGSIKPPAPASWFGAGWSKPVAEGNRVFAVKHRTFDLKVMIYRVFADAAEFRAEVERLKRTAAETSDSKTGTVESASGIVLEYCETRETKAEKTVDARIDQWFLPEVHARYVFLIESTGRFRSQAFQKAQQDGYERIKASLRKSLAHDPKLIEDTYTSEAFGFAVSRPDARWRFRPTFASARKGKTLSLVLVHPPTGSRLHLTAGPTKRRTVTRRNVEAYRDQLTRSFAALGTTAAETSIRRLALDGVPAWELRLSVSRDEGRRNTTHILLTTGREEFTLRFYPITGLKQPDAALRRILSSFRWIRSGKDPG